MAYILIKAAISPRPANWILERSLDGQVWAPWQFFALSDEECWHAYGVEPKIGKPNSYRYDEEVICTSYYSKLDPLENGEVSFILSKLKKSVKLNHFFCKFLTIITKSIFYILR